MTTEISEVDKNLNTILETEYKTIEEESQSSSTEIVPVINQLPAVIESPDRDVEFDYEYSRITHRDLIDRGSEALEGILKVAKESQHPRAYEVAGNMLKNISDMTDKLMVLHEKKKTLENNNKGGTTNLTVEKAVFVGSTSDLLKQVRQDKLK